MAFCYRPKLPITSFLLALYDIWLEKLTFLILLAIPYIINMLSSQDQDEYTQQSIMNNCVFQQLSTKREVHLCSDLMIIFREQNTNCVAIHENHSTSALLCHGVPQGQILELIPSIHYTQHLSNAIKHYPLFCEMYADDTHIYKSCRPSEIVDTINSIEQCISNVKTWMFHNKV